MRNISLRIMLWILCLGFVSVANAQIFDKENDNQIGDTAVNFSFINENGVNLLDYFDAVVRNTVESVLVISQNKIKIKYVGGIEITKSI